MIMTMHENRRHSENSKSKIFIINGLLHSTGGHLIEFHLIESLDRNFLIKRLKIDQLIE